MAEASAAAVYTGNQGGRGDNSGSAPVLDQAADFLPYAIQFQQKREAARAAEATRLREAKKDQDKAWAALEIDMPDVWAADSPYLEQDLTKYHDSLVDEKLKGGNPLDPYSESGKMRKQNETQIKKRTSLAKDNEAYFTANKEAIAKDAAGKYDRKYAADWFTKYTDPKMTPEDRAKMRLDSSPYKLNYSSTGFIDDTIPDYRLNSSGTQYVVDRDAHVAKMAGVFASPEGEDVYNTLKKGSETMDQTIERLADEAQEQYKPYRAKAEPQPNSNNNSGSSAAAKVNIVMDTLDTTGLAQDGKPNIARVNRLGTQDDLPPIGVKNEDNQTINFQPLEFVVNDKTGKIGVSGLRFDEKKPKDPMQELAVMQQAIADLKAGKPLSAESKASGVQEVWVDYNRNRTAFESQTGVDMYQQFGRTDPDKAKKGGEVKTENKKETPAERAARIAKGG